MVVVVTCSVVVVVGSRIDYCEFDNEQLCINAKNATQYLDGWKSWPRILVR